MIQAEWQRLHLICVVNNMNSEQLRDTVLEIDLKQIKRNYKLIRELCGEDVAIMPVIKANAYGMGAAGIAPTLMDCGATYLAVASLNEALELRQANQDYPIFILGHTPDRLAPVVIENNITQTVVSYQQAKAFSDAAIRLKKKVTVHLKVDTGFHRLGISDEEEIYRIALLPGLYAEGIFTHLALVNDEENERQFKLFMQTVRHLQQRGVCFRYQHMADSISLVDYPQYRLNMVRPGALLFGLRGFHKGFLQVEPCMKLHTRISQIHEIKSGEGVGYDYLWRASRDTRVGTLPIGYADGYPRNMRGKGYATVDGVKCPIIGVICMDQCMIDLGSVPQAREGDLAIIYGDGRGNTMSIQEAANLAETNKNEITARIAKRVIRVYNEI